MQVDSNDFPSYVVVETEKEFEDQIKSGQIPAYYYDGGPIDLSDFINRKFGVGYRY